jgi:hypothetical protein
VGPPQALTRKLLADDSYTIVRLELAFGGLKVRYLRCDQRSPTSTPENPHGELQIVKEGLSTLADEQVGEVSRVVRECLTVATSLTPCL